MVRHLTFLCHILIRNKPRVFFIFGLLNLVVFLLFSTSIPPPPTPRAIPITITRKIWSYWDEGPLDSLATTCKASWTTYAPSYEISTITLASVADYNLKLPSNFYSLGAAAKSDAVRLAILFEKGGIWLDAHVLLRRPIAWIEDFVASAEIDSATPIFAPPGSSSRPYVESWLVVVPEPKNPLVEKWSTTLSSTLEFVSNSSLLSSPAYSLTKWCTTNNDYFMVYQTFCHLSERDASFRSGVVRLPIWTFFAINPFFSSYYRKLPKIIRVLRNY